MKPKIYRFSIIIPGILSLAIPNAKASLVLYSSTFTGPSGTDLHGTAVTTSGATAAQHAQYGTSATATWSAAARLKADGSFVHNGMGYNSTTNTVNRASGTLLFDPQDGYVYTLTMTTNYVAIAPITDWFAMGFFMQPNYTGAIQVANGATVWALTRPGSGNTNGDQVAHYNLAGGTGAQGAPSASEVTTAPSTLKIVLNTTAGTGNWSATYYVNDAVLATKADLNAVDIDAVGIGVGLDAASFSGGKFQSFELSVDNLFATWISGKSGVNGQTAVGDDPDGDGIENGVENFFGTEPGVFSQGLQAGGVSGSTFTFTHPINATPATDLTPTYRWSKDLLNFTPGGGTHDGTSVTITPGTPSGGFVTVTAEVSGTPTGKLFIDVQVSQP
jgi:hypothetical protein